MNSRQKGKLIEKKVIEILEADSCRVEQAHPKLGWYKDKQTGQLKVRSLDHDFFGLFDLIAVPAKPKGKIRFIQVSVWANRSFKARMLLGGGFPKEQEIWLYVQERGKSHFRICHSKDNFEWHGERETPIKKKSKYGITTV